MADGSGEVVVVPVTGAANGLNNGAGGTSAQTSNPLSRKLRKILDTRLDNDKVSGAGGAEGRASLGAGVGGWSSVRRPRACPLSSPRGGHPRPVGSPGCVADVGQSLLPIPEIPGSVSGCAFSEFHNNWVGFHFFPLLVQDLSLPGSAKSHHSSSANFQNFVTAVFFVLSSL